MARFISLLAVLIVFVDTGQYAIADKVVPSNRVTYAVNVRAEPRGVDSLVVGILRSGEAAEYVGSAPHWYHIRLDDGVEGFVSKAWTRIVADPQATVTPELELHFIDVGQLRLNTCHLSKWTDNPYR